MVAGNQRGFTGNVQTQMHVHVHLHIGRVATLASIFRHTEVPGWAGGEPLVSGVTPWLGPGCRAGWAGVPQALRVSPSWPSGQRGLSQPGAGSAWSRLTAAVI